MSDETTLLPCPFCGGEAQVLKDGLPYVVIECERCFCRTNCNVTEAEAIAAWNTRAELGRGTLTANDVLNAVYKHGARWQAIADELNAEMGSGTCELREASWDDGTCTWGVICSSCGAKHEHTHGYGWNFAPCCGKRVIA